MKLLEKPAITFDDVLIVPQYSEIETRADVDTSWELSYGEDLSIKFRIPVMSSNMYTVTGVEMAIKMAELGGLGVLHRYMSPEEQENLYHFIKEKAGDVPVCHSIGTTLRDAARISYLLDKGCFDILCLDTAHGDTSMVHSTIKHIQTTSPKPIPLIVGNVVTAEAASYLTDELGVSLVKVGVGPGQVCTTRATTGVGYPQLQAVMDTAKVADVIADGGIRNGGDVAKAIGAGASCVMIGSLLAGTDGVPGWSERNIPGKEACVMAGNASSFTKSQSGQQVKNIEGVSFETSWKHEGSTESVITSLMEGLRSSMAYTGARNIKEMQDKVVFTRVSGNTTLENGTRKY